MKYVKKYWKTGIKYIVIAFVVALLVEFLCQFDIAKAVITSRGNYDRYSFRVEDLSYENLNILKKNQIICGDDPQIYLNDINGYVSDVEIKLNKISASVIPVQIFYSYDGITYLQEQSVSQNYTENRDAIFVSVSQNVVSLRIDIGSTSEDAYYLDQIIVNPSIGDCISAIFDNMSCIRILFYFIGILLLVIAMQDFDRFKNFMFIYRWQIGIALIAVCTLCRIHGSSIGLLAELISGYDTSKLWGTSRSIRSDEYVVFTEMALSQVKSGFSHFSDIWGYSATDMFMTYGQPILNIVTLYRPFSIGYILFGAECGLAFFWSARIIVLFLVSFEFGRLFTSDERRLSLAYAFLVTLAPVVQWWFSVNELVEMLIFGQLAIIIVYLYINCNAKSKKIIYMMGLVLCAGGYIMALYPAWMIPLFYVFFACGISLLIENRNSIQIKLEDILIWSIGIAVLIVSMFYIFKTSNATIMAEMNTVYPGSRRYYGGPFENIIELFRGWSSYLWTFIDIQNPCEEVDFIGFFPIGLILSVIVLFKQKKKDTWLIVLNTCNTLLLIYFLLDLPEIIGKITLLNLTSKRLVNAIGFLNLIILFRSMKLMEWKEKSLRLIAPVSVIFGVCGYYGVLSYLTPSLMWIIVILTGTFAYMISTYGKKENQNLFVVSVILISIIGGGLVNPINCGLNSIYNTKLLQEIEKINSQEMGAWVVNDEGVAVCNLPTIVGAKCINAVATYPDYAMWEDLDLKDCEEIWNRYAHISVTIADYVAVENAGSPDHIRLYITISKLKELGVKYILSTSDLSQFSGVEPLYYYNSFSIWELQ